MKHALLILWFALGLQAQYPYIVPTAIPATLVATNGGAVSWSVNNVISYAQLNLATGYWNVWTINPDGTGATCITCPTSPGASSLPNSGNWSSGAPVWSADGNYIIFQAQEISLGNTTGSGVSCNGKPPGTAPKNDGPAFPGEGSWNDLYAVNVGTGTFTRLTNQSSYGQYVACGGVYVSGGTGCPGTSATVTFNGSNGQTTNAAGTIAISGGVPTGAITLNAGGSFYTSVPTVVQVTGCTGTTTITGAKLAWMGGVIYPTLSWDGTKLAWGQRLINNPPGTQAAANTSVWELCTASFSEPTIGTPACERLGTGAFPYVEPRSWSADNSTVFFMGSLSGETGSVKNVYSYNPSTGVLFNLTNSSTDWNEYPVALPPSWGSNKIIWMLYPFVGAVNPQCVADWWVMNYDGTDKYQLTFFNTPGNPNFINKSPNPNTMPGGSCMDTHSWNPAGTQLVMYNNTFAANGQSGNQGPDLIFNVANNAGAPLAVTSVAYPGAALMSGVTMQ
jgi:hypothetical protein